MFTTTPGMFNADTQALVVNVADFGATAGVADHANAINNAIAASAPGQIIYFPLLHPVGSTIQFLPNRRYAGTSGVQGGSGLRQINGANLAAVAASSGWFNNATLSDAPIAIEHLLIDGNSANNSSTHGLVLMNFFSAIRECYIQNTPGDGIRITAANKAGSSISNTAVENRIERCKIDNITARGINIVDSSNAKVTDGFLQDNVLSNITDRGIQIDSAPGWLLEKNHLYSIGQTAFSLTNMYGTRILGNYIENFGTANPSGFVGGIVATLHGPRASIIADNQIANGETSNLPQYNYLYLQANDVNPVIALLQNNHIAGNFSGNPSGNPGNSLGLILNTTGTQSGSGKPYYLMADYSNRFENVGTTFTTDGYATKPASPYNLPVGSVSAPAFPATTVAATNNSGYDVTAYVTNGINAITQVQIAGAGGVYVNTNFQIAASGWGTIRLAAGASVKFTYAGGTPTWTWFGD